MKEEDTLWTEYLLERLISVEVVTQKDIDSVELLIEYECGIIDYRFSDINSSVAITRYGPHGFHLTTHSKRSSELETLEERVSVCKNGEDGIEFIFLKDSTCLVEAGEQIVDFLKKYTNSRTCQAKDLVDDVVNYLQQSNFKFRDGSDELREIHARRLVDNGQSQVLRTVKRSEQNRLIGEGDYLTKLYTDTINQNVNNLKIFEFNGKNYPYVLVDSSQIEGVPGKPFLNLYFVASDIAPEVWQQQIVAYHESMCVPLGHEVAREREREIVRHLGMEDDYKIWLAGIEG